MGSDQRAKNRTGIGFAVGFDTDGKPMAQQSTDDVAAKFEDAWDDPDSTVVMSILKKGEDLFIQVAGPPDPRTLKLLKHATETYRKILYGKPQ